MLPLVVSLDLEGSEANNQRELQRQSSVALDSKGEGTPTSSSNNAGNLVERQKENVKSQIRTESQYSSIFPRHRV